MSKPIVAIVGRPNVGKSTLFNQIGKKRVSIVDDMPGVTRDRIYLDAEWLNHEFTMVDTGGIEFDESKKFNFSLEISADGYDSIIYNFEISVTSENKIQLELNTVNSIKIKDLVIFREGTLEGVDE